MNPKGPSADEGFEKDLGLAIKRVLKDLVIVGDKVYKQDIPKVTETLEREISARLKANLSLEPRKAKVGEEIHLQLHLANEGRTPVFLAKIEEIFPQHFDLITKPDYIHLSAGFLDLNKKQLNPSEIEDLDLAFIPLSEGTFSTMPRLSFFNGAEQQMTFDPCCATVEIQENIYPNRVKTGYKDLDNLLLGGIPEKYAVILTSVSCDERELLVKKFLETALKSGEATLCFTIDAMGVKALTERFSENFFLFICNPQAGLIIKEMPNVYQLKGVENLIDINIALNSAIRKLDNETPGERRAYIGIISDVLLQHGAIQTRRWLTGLITELRSRGFTTLAHVNPYMHRPEEVQAILDLFEGEINIIEEGPEKLLQIKKLLNQPYLANQRLIKKSKLTDKHLRRRGKWQRY
ncbi:MAG: hypothetical protein JSV51_08415 [Candidatus Bathyarchaeota archaeon]|nr:MAG: hypothetical protein JSV51_08415 [Candidatus Bathyarchaeota archaeon]